MNTLLLPNKITFLIQKKTERY